MINLKKLLAKILQQVKILSDQKFFYQEGHMWGTSSTTAIKTYNTWQNFTAFGRLDGNGNNSNCYEYTPNGFKILKSGYYFFTCCGHANCTASLSNGLAISMRWFNVTKNSIIGTQRFFYDKKIGAIHFYITAVGSVSVNDVVTVQMMKYSPNDATSYFRPSLFLCNAIYLSSNGTEYTQSS